MDLQSSIFLCHAREDEIEVKHLYHKLLREGFKPWVYTKDMFPGERWRYRIENSIKRSDFFLACLSLNSVKKRGFFQKEIDYAINIWKEKLYDDIYLIPVRLDNCVVPERLEDLLWVDIFEENGWDRLIEAIQVGAKRRERESKSISQERVQSKTSAIVDNTVYKSSSLQYEINLQKITYDKLHHDKGKSDEGYLINYELDFSESFLKESNFAIGNPFFRLSLAMNINIVDEIILCLNYFLHNSPGAIENWYQDQVRKISQIFRVSENRVFPNSWIKFFIIEGSRNITDKSDIKKLIEQFHTISGHFGSDNLIWEIANCYGDLHDLAKKSVFEALCLLPEIDMTLWYEEENFIEQMEGKERFVFLSATDSNASLIVETPYEWISTDILSEQMKRSLVDCEHKLVEEISLLKNELSL